MSTTLVLDLTAPQQSWVSGGSGPRRRSMDRPTKSGVVGIVANAMGRNRTDPIDDIAALTFSVVEIEKGYRNMDYRSIGGGTMPTTLTERIMNPYLGDEAGYSAAYDTSTADDSMGYRIIRRDESRTSIFKTDFLSNASFRVGLSGDPALLDAISQALFNPERPVFLGRKRYHPKYPDLRPEMHEIQDVSFLSGINEGLRYWSENISAHSLDDVILSFEQPMSFRTDVARHSNYRSLRVAQGVTK